jgi:hypothetical protein
MHDVEGHGKERPLHQRVEHLLEIALLATEMSVPELEAVLAGIGGAEEGQPLDVVEVGMGEQDVPDDALIGRASSLPRRRKPVPASKMIR